MSSFKWAWFFVVSSSLYKAERFPCILPSPFASILSIAFTKKSNADHQKVEFWQVRKLFFLGPVERIFWWAKTVHTTQTWAMSSTYWITYQWFTTNREDTKWDRGRKKTFDLNCRSQLDVQTGLIQMEIEIEGNGQHFHWNNSFTKHPTTTHERHTWEKSTKLKAWWQNDFPPMTQKNPGSYFLLSVCALCWTVSWWLPAFADLLDDSGSILLPLPHTKQFFNSLLKSDNLQKQSIGFKQFVAKRSSWTVLSAMNQASVRHTAARRVTTENRIIVHSCSNFCLFIFRRQIKHNRFPKRPRLEQYLHLESTKKCKSRQWWRPFVWSCHLSLLADSAFAGREKEVTNGNIQNQSQPLLRCSCWIRLASFSTLDNCMYIKINRTMSQSVSRGWVMQSVGMGGLLFISGHTGLKCGALAALASKHDRSEDFFRCLVFLCTFLCCLNFRMKTQ